MANKLTPAQKELLRDAIERGGKLRAYAVNHRTVQALADAGFIKRDFAESEERRAEMTAEIDNLVESAKAIIGSDWHNAYADLKRAAGLEDQRNYKRWWITNEGRQAIA